MKNSLLFLMSAFFLSSCSSISSQDGKSYVTIELNNNSDRQIINEFIKNKKPIEVRNENNEKFIVVDRDEGKKFKINEKMGVHSYSLFSGCITNDMNKTIRDAIIQFGGFDKDRKFTLMFDSSNKGESNFINYFGLGISNSTGVAFDKMVILESVRRAKENKRILKIYGCGAGGRRNYNNILNFTKNQFKDELGNSVVEVKYYGTPANNINLKETAEFVGATYYGHQIKFSDFTGNILGMNGGIHHTLASLFDFRNWTSSEKSPHLNYYCEGSGCNYSSE